MKEWPINSTEIEVTTPYFSLRRDDIEDLNGVEQKYWYLQDDDAVLIVPIKLNADKSQITYIMVNQYRHPTRGMMLEFPQGGLKDGEEKEVCAKRELKEETGLDAKWLKFMYKFYPSPGRTTAEISVYMALVEGEPSVDFAESSEIGAGLEVVQVSADSVLQKIQLNEITDGHTLAALGSVMLQSDEAKRYIESIG